MRRRLDIRVLRLAVGLAICLLAWTQAPHAAVHASVTPTDPFGQWTGDAKDNFYNLNMVYCSDGLIVHARQVAQDSDRHIVDPPTGTSFLTSDPSAFSLVVTKISDGGGDVPVTPTFTTDAPFGEIDVLGHGIPSHYVIAGAASANTNTFGAGSPPTPASGTAVFHFGRPIDNTLTTRIERWDHGVAGLQHSTDGADDNFDYGDTDDPTDNDLAADISGSGDTSDPNEGKSGDEDTADTDTLDDRGDGSAGDDSKIFTSGVDTSCSILPSTTATDSPSANGNGWNKSTVTVKLTATDGAADALNAAAGSTIVNSAAQIAGIDYTATNNTPAQTFSGHITGASGSFDITTEGVWTVRFHATDIYGNSEATESYSINPVQIDETAPSLNIAGVPATPTVQLCSSPAAHPSFSPSFNPTDPALADGSAGSGVAASGDSYTPSTTASGAGTYTYSAHATDNAGNTRTETHTWSVQYPYRGPLPPISTNVASFKLGRTVPVTFTSFCVGARITNIVARLYVQKGQGPLMAATSTSPGTTGNFFRYETAGNQYVFNLATSPLSTGTWTLHTKLDDGTDHTVTIQLTR